MHDGVRAWLANAGVEPPEDPVAGGPDADQEAVARKILLDQLTGQARSRSELAGKLAAKGVPDELAARLLDRFEEVGLVDDQAFARAWVQSRQPGKGLARRALAQELRRKGVDRIKAIRRLAGMLARKGYPPGVAMSVVREELEAAGQGAEDDLLDPVEPD